MSTNTNTNETATVSQNDSERMSYQEHINELFDLIVEEHRDNFGSKDTSDEDIFLITLFLHLDDRGYDIPNFAEELVELSRRTKNKLNFTRRLTNENNGVVQ
jgi:hypothetical protein